MLPEAIAIVMAPTDTSRYSFLSVLIEVTKSTKQYSNLMIFYVILCSLLYSPHGIFHLSDPGGVSVIRNCQQRGFHPHEEPPDGNPIYEHCSHVFMNPSLKFDVVDLR